MNRRKHSNEFKLEAVKLAERGEVAVSQVARDLGICESLLHRWINEFPIEVASSPAVRRLIPATV
jgi:transposase-like protein